MLKRRPLCLIILIYSFVWASAWAVPCTVQQSVTNAGNTQLSAGSNDGAGEKCGASLTGQNTNESTLVVPSAITAMGSLNAVSVLTNPSNYGNVTFLGTNTVAGSMGTASKYLNIVTLSGDNTKTVTFNGSLYVLNFTQGDGASVVNAASNIGKLELDTGGVTVNAALTLFGQNNSGAVQSTFTGDGTLTLAGENTLTMGIYFLGSYLPYGTLKTATPNTGTVILSGSGTVTGGALGETEAPLKAVRAGANGTTSTINAGIYATTLNVTGTGTVALGGETTAAVVYASTGIVTLADGVDLTGAVTNGAGNQGTLSLLGTNEVTGQIAVSGQKLNTVNAGAASKTATFNNIVYATTYNHSGTGTTVLGGGLTGTTVAFGSNDGIIQLSANKTITANITNAAVAIGTLKLSSGSTVLGNIASANYLKQMSLLGSAQVGTQASDSLTVKLKNLALDQYTLSLYGDTSALSLLGSGSLSLAINDLDTYGSISVVSVGNTQAVIIPNDLTIDVAINSFIPNGSVFTVIENGVSEENIDGAISVDTHTARIQMTSSISANSLILTAHRQIAAVSGRSVGVLSAVNSVQDASGDLGGVLGIIDAMNDSDANNAYTQLAPAKTESMQFEISSRVSEKANSALLGRLESARTGVNSGEMVSAFLGSDGALWLKGFSGYGHQATQQSVAYSDRIGGGLLGVDFLMNSKTRLGFAGGYSRAHVNASDGSEKQLIQSYRAMGFATKDWNSRYMEGVLSASWNHYNTLRSILFPGISRLAISDNEGKEIVGMLGGGYRYRYDNWRITPRGSMRYGFAHVGSYRESGADQLNLSVIGRGYHLWQGDLGVKVTYPLRYNSFVFVPGLRANYIYDFISNAKPSIATFTGGGVAFPTTAARASRGAYNFGVGLSTFGSGRTRLTVDYDWEHKGRYRGHLLGVTGRYYFS